jgi:hypothetical protein
VLNIPEEPKGLLGRAIICESSELALKNKMAALLEGVLPRRRIHSVVICFETRRPLIASQCSVMQLCHLLGSLASSVTQNWFCPSVASSAPCLVLAGAGDVVLLQRGVSEFDSRQGNVPPRPLRPPGSRTAFGLLSRPITSRGSAPWVPPALSYRV